jgi:hypothetical protein
MYGAPLKQHRFACGAHCALYFLWVWAASAAQAYFLWATSAACGGLVSYPRGGASG